MKIKGWDLDFFNSGEWQVCDERLKDLEKVNRKIHTTEHNPGDGYNPGRENLFRALRLTPASDVRVAIIGQDPYPTREFATGLAFSIPAAVAPEFFPLTLQIIFKEYCSDLGLPLPSKGNLDGWAERGVLLWNAIPSCGSGKSLSHDWNEWKYLTTEIIRTLSKRGIVFAFLGQVAKQYAKDVDPRNNQTILTSHPSPRGNNSSKTPFLGSRLFSTINDKLVSNGQAAIDWKLP
jgi:uracil-DNA glycosylase